MGLFSMFKSREKCLQDAERYMAQGDYNSALKEYDSVLSKNMQDNETGYKRSVALYMLKRYDDAIKEFQVCMLFGYKCHLELALCEKARKNLKAALKYIQTGRDIKGGSKDYYGKLFFQEGLILMELDETNSLNDITFAFGMASTFSPELESECEYNIGLAKYQGLSPRERMTKCNFHFVKAKNLGHKKASEMLNKIKVEYDEYIEEQVNDEFDK